MALHLLIGLQAQAGRALVWPALLLTYCLHAALWAVAASIAARLQLLAPLTRRAIWRLALLGPIVTTLLTGAASWPALASTLGRSSVREISLLSVPENRGSPSETQTPEAKRVSIARPKTSASLLKPPTHAGRVDVGQLVTIGAGLAAGLGLLRFMIGALLFRRRLGRRVPVTDHRLLSRFAALCERLLLPGVALTECDEITSPLVLRRSEVCVPRALLSALPDRQIDAIFAHELAHLEHRDGVWFVVAGLVQAVLWIQPFNHWVAARFRQSAELACDDRAVALTGDALGLAEALTRVAEFALHKERAVMAAPGMARSGSSLVQRVTRLVGASQGSGGQVGCGPWSAQAWVLGTFAAFGIATASFSVRGAPAGRELASAVAVSSARNSGPAELREIEALSRQMVDLASRERELERELGFLLQHSVSTDSALDDARRQRAESESSAAALEFEQELRHLRAAQVRTEQQMLELKAATDRGGNGPRTH